MRDKTTENTHSPFSDFEVLVLHAVEKHEKIFVARYEGIKLGVQMFKHSHSDSVFIICSSSYKKAMEEFVDYALDIWTNLKLVGWW